MSDLRFVVLADTQFGMFASSSGKSPEEIEAAAARGLLFRPAPKFEGLAPETALFEEAVAKANELRPRFVVICGDMVNDPVDRAQIAEVRRIAKLLDPSIRLRYVPGNHDVAFDTNVPTRESLAHYRAEWGNDYYSFVEEGVVFIALNTTVLWQPEKVPGEWEAQYDFVDETLSTARARGIDRAILLGHHPLFVKDAEENDDYWNIPRVRRDPLMRLIRRYKVDAMFAGHLHENAYATDGRFQMVTSGPVGYPLGHDPSGYRIVEVEREGVDHQYHFLTSTPPNTGGIEVPPGASQWA